MKPILFDRFLRAVNKAYGQVKLNKKVPERSLALPEKETQSDFIMVKTGYNTININLNDILYVEGLKDYIKIHLHSSAKAIVTRMAMKAIEEQLPTTKFIRIHKSYIVSIGFITAIKKTSVFIGSIELPVSDNYKDSVIAITGKLW